MSEEKPKKLSRAETLDIILEKLKSQTYNDTEVVKVKNTLKAIVKATKKPSKIEKILKPRFVKIYNRFEPAKDFLNAEYVALRDKMRDANLKRLEKKNLRIKKKIEIMRERCKI